MGTNLQSTAGTDTQSVSVALRVSDVLGEPTTQRDARRPAAPGERWSHRAYLKRLHTELGPGLDGALETRGGVGDMSLLLAQNHVADDTMKVLVRDRTARTLAVLLCSCPASPDLVARGMENAARAKAMLGPELGGPILTPWIRGAVDGLSYVVLPYCKPFGGSGLGWALRRGALRAQVVKWLRQVTQATVSDPTPAEVRSAFVAPLEHIASHPSLGRKIRGAADAALTRLKSGQWRPRHVLAHNDLCWENLLHTPREVVKESGEGAASTSRNPRNPPNPQSSWGFVAIDWPGAVIKGHGMYDLLRLAASVRLPRRDLETEVAAHCRLLGCEACDAPAHLLAGLGRLGMNIEHFPVASYVAQVKKCFATLTGDAAPE